LKNGENLMIMTALIITFGTLGLIGLVFLFVSKMVKGHFDVVKMKTQKEILELELQKQNNDIKLLEEENKKYDRIINESN